MMANKKSNYAFQSSEPVVRNRFAANSAFPQHRAIVDWNRSPWAQELNSRLNELTSLVQGWDGYEGVPVSWDCATFAANLIERIYVVGLSAPSLVPGSDGTLQIEWHKNNYDVEIDVLGVNKVIATKYDHLTRDESVLDLDNDITVIVSWVRELSTERVHFEAASA